jgi:putative membrane protein
VDAPGSVLGVVRAYSRTVGMQLLQVSAGLSRGGTAVLLAHGDEHEEPVAPISITRVFTESAIVWWLAALLLLGAALYLGGVWKLRARGDYWSPWRTASFLGPGLALIAYASMGGPGYYDDTVLSVHMIQHMLLMMVAPVFLALGAPVTLALRTLPRPGRRALMSVLHSRAARIVTFPLVGWGIYVASPFALYFTGWYRATLEHPWLHELMHIHFLLVGCLFFWPMVGIDPIPGRVSHPLRFLVVMSTLPFHAILGLAIYTMNELIAGDYYPSLHQAWLDPLEDQKVAGGLLWSSGEAVGLIMLLVIGIQWMHASEREAVREDRRLDRLEAEAAGRSALGVGSGTSPLDR